MFIESSHAIGAHPIRVPVGKKNVDRPRNILWIIVIRSNSQSNLATRASRDGRFETSTGFPAAMYSINLFDAVPLN